jgi:hypothetical protein
VIDGHKLEKQAMELFKRGDAARASQLQDEFLAEVMSSGEDLCSCPEACKFHGKCVECVLLHRGHGDHLPRCFDNMAAPGAPE